jgi:hypothetical protein
MFKFLNFAWLFPCLNNVMANRRFHSVVAVIDFHLSNDGICNLFHFSFGVGEPVGKCHVATGFNITTILLIMRFELADQVFG